MADHCNGLCYNFANYLFGQDNLLLHQKQLAKFLMELFGLRLNYILRKYRYYNLFSALATGNVT